MHIGWYSHGYKKKKKVIYNMERTPNSYRGRELTSLRHEFKERRVDDVFVFYKWNKCAVATVWYCLVPLPNFSLQKSLELTPSTQIGWIEPSRNLTDTYHHIFTKLSHAGTSPIHPPPTGESSLNVTATVTITVAVITVCTGIVPLHRYSTSAATVEGCEKSINYRVSTYGTEYCAVSTVRHPG